MGRRLSVVIAAVSLLSLPAAPLSLAVAHSEHHHHWTRLIAWSTKGLPRGTGRALDRMAGVRATTVLTGSVFMKRSIGPAGHSVDNPRGTYRIPLDVAYVQRRGYRHFVAPRRRARIMSLERGHALMARPEVGLRQGHARLRLRLTVGRLKSVGKINPRDAQGYELITPAPAPRPVQTLRTELIRKRHRVPIRRIRRRIASRLQAGDRLRLDTARKARYLRYADRAATTLEYKKALGEFAMRFSSGSSVQLLPRWVHRHIRNARVPILGHVTCNRAMIPQLRGALRTLKRHGLAHLVHRDQYAGCYNSRYVTGGHQRLSRHAWGGALDMNTSGNCFGCTPHQPRRLVKVMRKHGFFWGGKFPTPDGMHFEWLRFPR